MLPAHVLHLNTARTWRGGERQTLLLARSLAERGVAQTVVGQPDSELERRTQAEGLPFQALRMRSEGDFAAARQLAFIIEASGACIIHAHTAKAHGLALLSGLLHRKARRAQLIVSRRVDFRARSNWLSRWKYRTPRVAAFIAISQNVRRILIEDGVPPERIHIAYSGIDLEDYTRRPDAARLRKEFSFPRNCIPIGNVAALVDHKDQRTLLDAASFLRGMRPRQRSGRRSGAPYFRLFIVGEGELREDLEQQAIRLGLFEDASVVFTGFRSDVDDFFGFFEIFAMSSKEEGLGTSVLDAMARGLPVVATDAGGLPEMVADGEGGLLSPAGDARAFAENLARLIADPQLRKTFGAFNQRQVRRFSREATCEATLEVYRSVLQNAGLAPPPEITASSPAKKKAAKKKAAKKKAAKKTRAASNRKAPAKKKTTRGRG